MNLIVEFIGNYSSNNYLHKYSKHYEKNDSMQVWLQRTVGCIALISLFFGCKSLGLCVELVGSVGGAEGEETVGAFAMYRIGDHSQQVR